MIDFYLPDELAAHEPAEARGMNRDDVRLLVSRTHENVLTHTRFHHFADFLREGDVLVVNTSATIKAAFEGVYERSDGSTECIRVHLSTPISNRRWVIELRRSADDLPQSSLDPFHNPNGHVTPAQHRNSGAAAYHNGSKLDCGRSSATVPLLDATVDERIHLSAGGTVTLRAPFVRNGNNIPGAAVRLWVAELDLPKSVLAYAAEYGSPIRYGYVPEPWPLDYYQTVFSKEPGSVEMPSAARAFTAEIVERLTDKGVQIVPVLLHTGVASLDADEPVYPERYRVSEAAAAAVNSARARGDRVVAVGTTVVRALETVAAPNGEVHPDAGWTNLVITPQRGLYAVDALLTGLHAPKASHLSMLEAIANQQHLDHVYKAALRRRYLWHEFGDLHLILPGSSIRPTFINTHRSYATC